MKPHLPHPGRRNEQGLVTLIFIILLAIMMILVMAESRALYHLNREVKFMEQQQLKRWSGSPANTITTTTSEAK
ncbi:MAG: hypothetical protein JF609_04845 [Verrucomicrobia bacterium]|nr:hypothetical protein [Verrucomicrobiota bacterium]